LTDFFDAAIIDALTQDGTVEIRDAATFAARSADARTTLYETAEELAGILEDLLEQREKIVDALEGLEGDSRYDLEMQLGFLFRPGFLQTLDVFGRYPRYLKAMQIRIQRFRNNAQTDAKKLAEVEPFQNRLNEKLMASDDIGSAYALLEFAMLLEEFRVNRFAPEIKTPMKVSAQRLEEAFQALEAAAL
jgi:ATP-dependent helicase HrpA